MDINRRIVEKIWRTGQPLTDVCPISLIRLLVPVVLKVLSAVMSLQNICPSSYNSHGYFFSHLGLQFCHAIFADVSIEGDIAVTLGTAVSDHLG